MKLAPSGVPYPPGHVPEPPTLVLDDEDLRTLDEDRRSVGRPTRYKKAYALQVRKLAGKRWTNEEIAEFLEIGLATFHRWRGKHLEFRDAIRLAREDLQTSIEESLAARALGYSHRDVHITNFQGHVTQTKITKHYPPDVSAAKFWLSNQARAKWSAEHAGEGMPDEDETPMSAEEAARIDQVLSESIDEH